MAAAFPYIQYACPCSDLTSSPPPPSISAKRASLASAATTDPAEESTFNPHDPRAAYALYPLDHLLFCEECEAIRCPRCSVEEVINWYCPSCLFEVPSSAVKGDGNRCSRNCYNCPVCTALLAVAAMPQRRDGGLQAGGSGGGGEEAYVLQCQYCDWSSLDIGVQFSKPTKITEQLAKLRKSRLSAPVHMEVEGRGAQHLSRDEAFANLTTFYKEQLSESGDPQNPYSNTPYSSPANLARIMSLYGGLSVNALKKTREKPQPMREARGEKEGSLTYSLDEKAAQEALLQRMRDLSWNDTPTAEQRLSAPPNNDARHVDELWPVATPLRTRKGKRCPTCRFILSRPESKVPNLRYKIRLLALSHVPRLSIRPLQQTILPFPNPAFRLRADDQTQADLQPHTTQQYVLTIRNPIFETIRVTLATPSTTPGRVASRVTILCPSFTIGPAGDVWEEALSSSTTSTSTITRSDGGRQAAMASLTGQTGNGMEDADRQPEAGKIWDRTRNSTSIIVEIVPGSLQRAPSIDPRSEEEVLEEELEEDDDVLEVPVYVRAEWEEREGGEGDVLGGGRRMEEQRKLAASLEGERVRREMVYWCVLGVGRIGGGG